MKISINAALNWQKHLKVRKDQLVALEKENSKRAFWADKDKTEEPVYDIKKIDIKLVEINKAIRKLDEMIKESNAKTKIEINFNPDELISPIE